jgi:cytochrome c-type biogenesis protein CcsB
MTFHAGLLVASLLAFGGAVLAGLVGVLVPRRSTAVAATPTGGVGAALPVAPQSPAMAMGALLLGGGFLLVALIVRTVAAGHAPWSNLHETAIAFAFGVVAVYAALARRTPIGGLAPLVAIVAGALVGVALSQPGEILPLVPALQAPLLLTVHVGSAMLAYAIAAVAFVAALGELVQRRAGGRLALLPSAATTRAVAHRAVLLGFPVLTAAILLGSVWANLAWRSYWSNDPKELAAAATWLLYGAYLHVAGRRDGWAAMAPWLLVIGFGAVLFTYLGAGLVFVGEHSYAGA